jgi:hypothetical protein
MTFNYKFTHHLKTPYTIYMQAPDLMKKKKKKRGERPIDKKADNEFFGFTDLSVGRDDDDARIYC